MQTSDLKVIINPDAAQVVSNGDGIWMMAQKRPLQLDWP
jgi:voltage-gated potassium channel